MSSSLIVETSPRTNLLNVTHKKKKTARSNNGNPIVKKNLNSKQLNKIEETMFGVRTVHLERISLRWEILVLSHNTYRTLHTSIA